MGFGQAGAKRCGGCLKVINWGWRCKSQKGALFLGKAGSHCVMLLSCEVFLQVLLGIYCKRFYWIPSFHYTTVLLRVWGLQSQTCNSKCPNETLNSNFLLYPWKFIILKPTPFPVCFFSVIVFVYCNFWLQSSILLIKAPLPIQSHKNTLLQLKIHIWMEFFWNQKFLFFHKRNFNPKVINYF